MDLEQRKLKPSDFHSVHEFWFQLYGRDHPDAEQMRQEWELIIHYPALVSIIIEEVRLHNRIARGYAAAVFVTDDYVRYVKEELPPYSNTHLLQPLPNGAEPLLAKSDIGAAQASGGLNALVAYLDWCTDELSLEDKAFVQDYLFRAFARIYRGYLIKNFVMQVIVPERHALAIAGGFTTYRDYAEWIQGAPMPIVLHQRPYLVGLTRDEALNRPVSSASQAFMVARPRFGFTEREREMLELALEGASDQECASTMCVSISTVHVRWKNIIDKVSIVEPRLLPPSGDREGGRGPEKRSRLLRYLHEHLEELRVHIPPSQKD